MIRNENGFKQAENLHDFQIMYNEINFNIYRNNEMAPEIKEPWLQALRSGKYKQGAGLLKSDAPQVGYGVRHCCLGVLAETCGVTEVNVTDSRSVSFEFPNSSMQHAYLDEPWAKSIGLLTGKGDFWISFKVEGIEFADRYSLTALNDTGFTFDQIADVIEYFF